MYLAFTPDTIGFSLSLKDCAETIAAIGYEGFWFNPGRDSAISAGETGELLARYKLRPAGFGLPVDLLAEEGNFRAALSKLKEYCRFARETGQERTATWIPPGSDTLDYRGLFELYRTRLREICGLLGEYGIALGLEFVGTPSFRRNYKNTFIYDLDGSLELIAAAGAPNLGLLLDLWHWDMAGQTRADFGKLSTEKKIVLVHLNDAPQGPSREEQIDTVRRLPGTTGVLRAGEFLDGLASLNYSGPLVVEPFYLPLKEMPFADAAKMVYDAARSLKKSG